MSSDENASDAEIIEDQDVDVSDDLLLNDENIEASEDQVLFEDDSIQGFFCHKKPVFCVDVKNGFAATGGEDDKGYLWSVESGDALVCVSAFSDSVVAAKFSTDGIYVAFGSMDGSVQVVDCRTFQPLLSLNGPSEVCSLEWHPKGNLLLAASSHGTVWMWSIPSGDVMNVFSGHTAAVSNATFSADGKSLVSIGDDGSLISWSPKDAQVAVKYSNQSDGRFMSAGALLVSVAVLDCGQMAFVGSSEGTLQLVSLRTHKICATLQGHTDAVEFVLVHPNAKRVITGGADGLLNIWDYDQATLLMSVAVDGAGFTCARWTNKDQWLFVTGSTDGVLRLWEGRSGNCLQQFKGHQDIVLDLAVLPDAKTVVSSSDDGTALVFEVR